MATNKPKSRRRSLLLLAIAVLALGVVMMWPVGEVDLSLAQAGPTEKPMSDFSTFSDARPERSLDILFIHHSVGGQWLAEPGPDSGSNCIYTSHPNGGGLRAALAAQGYTVHEASYNSQIGQSTDLFDWLPKFTSQMDRVLTCRLQDESLFDGRRNQIALFKSCYPNSNFTAAGTEPGHPAGPELTVANAKATYRELLKCFAQEPQTLFVCVTTPPLAPRVRPQPLWKAAARTLLGKPGPAEKLARASALAAEVNAWLLDPDGWLKDYPHPNVAVFDYRGVLTAKRSDFLAYPSGDGFDSHPSSEGQKLATQAFVPFLNRAVRRAGLAP